MTPTEVRNQYRRHRQRCNNSIDWQWAIWNKMHTPNEQRRLEAKLLNEQLTREFELLLEECGL